MTDLSRYVRHLLGGIWPKLRNVPITWVATQAEHPRLWDAWRRIATAGDEPAVVFAWRNKGRGTPEQFVALIDARWLLLLLRLVEGTPEWANLLRYPEQAMEWFHEAFNARTDGDE